MNQEQQARFQDAYLRVRKMRPRLFCQSYFKIQNRRTRRIEPWRYVLNQVYFEEQLAKFGEDPYATLLIHMLKDRQAKWSTWINGYHTANLLCLPGWHVLKVSSSDKNLLPHFKQVRGFIDGMYGRDDVDEDLLPRLGDRSKERQSVIHPGNVESSITYATASSADFARGYSFDCLDYDEAAFYREAFADEFVTAVEGALRPDWQEFHGSTPNGPAGPFYAKYRAIKDGEIQGLSVKRYWYQNSDCHLPRLAPQARDEDQGLLVPGEGSPNAGVGNEMVHLAEINEQSKLDDVPVEDRLRYRRYEIGRQTAKFEGDLNMGMAVFFQEHMEDEETCWLTVGRSPLNFDIMNQMRQMSRHPQERRTLAPGFVMDIYQEPQPGGNYALGYDTAGGGAGRKTDESSASILRCAFGYPIAEVATINGKVGLIEGANLVVQAANFYNHAYLAIEVTGGYGIAAVEAALRLGYGPRLYKRRIRPGESVDAYLKVGYGIDTGQKNKRQMGDLLVGTINGHNLIIQSREDIAALMSWEADDTKHTPDRVMSKMLALWAIETGPSASVYQYRPQAPAPAVRTPLEVAGGEAPQRRGGMWGY